MHLARRLLVLPAVALAGLLTAAPVRALDVVPLPDIHDATTLPKIWVVNMPDSNAKVHLTREHPIKKHPSALDLHYVFTGGGQYLGIPLDVKIKAPIHQLHVMMYGDKSGTGYGLYVQDASGEVHKFRDPATMKVNFSGWKDVVFNLDGGHETWGGDKNGKIDYPVTQVTFEISTPGKAATGDLLFTDLRVDSEKNANATLNAEVAVVSPPYCSEIHGNAPITVSAAGLEHLVVHSWKPGGEFGSDATIATLTPDAQGRATFTFPADQFPHGPITVTITGTSGDGPDAVKDNCYLQLYNTGGIKWNQGLPADPPAAKGLQLVFADDFTKMPAFSDTDPKATYYDHKPPHGSQDFSSIPFTSADKPNNPFAQMDTWLRIRADAKANSAGIISSAKSNGTGILASAPCYFECRFIGPNAIGTWPAFWLLTNNLKNTNSGCDELDIIEAYGGEGPHHPNSHDKYMVTPHAWAQGEEGHKLEQQAFKDMHDPIEMHKVGIPSTWYEAAHTYGCLITKTDTIYYCDNIEIGRHPTLPLSKTEPFFFLINLATGGGWPVDLSRYDGKADMYVDFVRVYAAKK